METRIITVPQKTILNLIERNFIKMCQFDLNEPNHRKLYLDAIKYREIINVDIDIRCKIVKCDKEVFQNNEIHFNNAILKSTDFSHIDEVNVKNIYLYAITIGEFSKESDEPVIQQLYSDIWGTAYIDAARDVLEKQLKAEIGSNLFLTSSFGPGFNGMTIDSIFALEKMIEMKEIGINLNQMGTMFPIKSVAGMYMVVDDLHNLPKRICAECIGNKKTCEFCGINILS